MTANAFLWLKGQASEAGLHASTLDGSCAIKQSIVAHIYHVLSEKVNPGIDSSDIEKSIVADGIEQLATWRLEVDEQKSSPAFFRGCMQSLALMIDPAAVLG